MARTQYPRFNQQTLRFLHRLEDILNSSSNDDEDLLDFQEHQFYIQLNGNSDDTHNLVRRLKDQNHRRVVIALLKSAEFYTPDFKFSYIPHHDPIAMHYYELQESDLPSSIELEANITFDDFSGVQKAVFDLDTFEVRYTEYIVKQVDCFMPLNGVGKIPIDDDDEFDFSRHIPVSDN